MEPGQAGGAGAGAKLVKRRARRRHAAEALQQFGQLINREVRPPVDPPIRGVLEVILNEVIAKFWKTGGGDLPRKQQLLRCAAFVGVNLQPIVVRPHEGELQALVIGRLEKAPVDWAFQVRAVIVVVPIEDEGVDAVIGGGGDFLRHHLGIGFIAVSPQRYFGLLVAGKARFGGLDQLPLGPISPLHSRVARIAGVIVAKVITGDGDGARPIGLRGDEAGGDQPQPDCAHQNR